MMQNAGNKDDQDRCGPFDPGPGFSEDEQHQLKENSKEVVFSPGETVIKQGTFSSHIFYLKKGLVKVVLESGNGKRIALQLLAPQTYFGLPFLETEYFHFGAEALKGSAICQIRKDTFRSIVRQNEHVNRFVMETYSHHYLDLFHKLEINSTRNNHGKLASLLYTLNGDDYQQENVFDYITRRDLAELASISRESTNKILREFENDRLVHVSSHGISIIRPELLKRLAMIG
jgi:CRP/FNR family transcriptional regulator